MQDGTKIFKALSDPNRIRILKALNMRTLCVCEVRELLGLANSTVSQHLSILREAGFIIEEREGKWVNYSINPRPSDARIGKIISELDFWTGAAPSGKNDKQKVPILDRIKICCS